MMPHRPNRGAVGLRHLPHTDLAVFGWPYSDGLFLGFREGHPSLPGVVSMFVGLWLSGDMSPEEITWAQDR
jgi:hypothetical protein